VTGQPLARQPPIDFLISLFQKALERFFRNFKETQPAAVGLLHSVFTSFLFQN